MSTWIVAMIAYLVLMVLASMLVNLFGLAGILQGDASFAVASIFVGIGVSFILSLLLQSLLMGGMYRMALNQIRGIPTSAGDVFQAFDLVPRFIITNLIIGVLAGIGFMLCIIPGLIVLGTTFLAAPLLAATNLSPIDAITKSFEVLKRDMLMAILFFIVVTIVASLGAIACGIGIIFTYPLLFISISLVYRDFFPEQFGSAPPPPAS
jgi:uncharacterized membrane protein